MVDDLIDLTTNDEGHIIVTFKPIAFTPEAWEQLGQAYIADSQAAVLAFLDVLAPSDVEA